MKDFKEEDRQIETFRRLHRLTAKGYVAKLAEHGGVDDAIFLDHLADGPSLILYPDGDVVALGDEAINPKDKECKERIFNESSTDAARFRSFLATVRLPTWRERTAPEREKYIYVPGCVILFFGGSWLISKLIIDWFNG